MTTLIAVYDKNGLVGRCDAKCYNAKQEACDCVCGGRNHGRGLSQAIQNTTELYRPMIEEYVKRRQLQSYLADVRVLDPVQLPLFEASS